MRYRNVEEQNYIEACLARIEWEEHERYAVEDQERERKAAYRKWFLAGHLEKDNPRGHRDQAVRERQDKIAREAFIGPPDRSVFDFERNHYVNFGYYTAGRFHDAAIRVAQEAFEATDIGRAEVERLEAERKADRQELIKKLDQAEGDHTRLLRREPHRLKIKPADAQAIIKSNKRHHDPNGLDDRLLQSICRVKPVSDAEGKLWDAQRTYDLPYLDYVARCENAGEDYPNRKEYMKLQRQYRKSKS